MRRICSNSAALRSIAPGSAACWMRAATLTPSPIRSSPSTMHVGQVQAETHRKRPVLALVQPAPTRRESPTAQRTAFIGLANSASTASPIALKRRPVGLGDLGVDQGAAGGHARGGSLLVGLHQARIACDHIRHENCRQAPLHRANLPENVAQVSGRWTTRTDSPGIARPFSPRSFRRSTTPGPPASLALIERPIRTTGGAGCTGARGPRGGSCAALARMEAFRVRFSARVLCLSRERTGRAL